MSKFRGPGHPDDANIHYNIATLLNFLGRNREALEWIDKGLALTKDNRADTDAFEALRLTILADPREEPPR